MASRIIAGFCLMAIVEPHVRWRESKRPRSRRQGWDVVLRYLPPIMLSNTLFKTSFLSYDFNCNNLWLQVNVVQLDTSAIIFFVKRSEYDMLHRLFNWF